MGKLSSTPPHPSYPVCQTFWGSQNMTAKDQLQILDFLTLAHAAYGANDQINQTLISTFNGTALGDFKLLDIQPQETIGRWFVIEFPQQKIRVVAVRGTQNTAEKFADLEIYSSVV